jgi:hypothetical protein
MYVRSPAGPALLGCWEAWDLIRFADITHRHIKDSWRCAYQGKRRITCRNPHGTRVIAYRIGLPHSCGSTYAGIGQTDIFATTNVTCDEARKVVVDNHYGGWPCGSADECSTRTDGYRCDGSVFSDQTDYICVRRDREVDYTEGP